jgi:hypothetical protein
MRALLLAVAAAAAAAQLTGTVAADGSYSVALGGVTWLSSPALPASAYALRFDGATHNTANGGLKVSSVTPTAGSDPVLGAYTGWEVKLNSGLALMRLLNYPARSAVVFEQHFPSGLNGTAYPFGSHAAQFDLATAFPVFAAPGDDSPLAFLTYAHVMCGPLTGRWAGKAAAGALSDEGGVLSLFNASFATVVVSSQAVDALAAQLLFANATGGAWAAGYGGYLGGVPPGWTHRTIMVGGQGVHDTWRAYGDVMLKLGGKTRPPPAGKFIDKLSYWTDNGA